MYRLSWKSCTSLISASVLITSALIGPIGYTGKASAMATSHTGQTRMASPAFSLNVTDLPHMINASLSENAIFVKFTKRLVYDSNSLSTDDFVVMVDDQPAELSYISPFLDAGGFTQTLIMLQETVAKGKKVTLAYRSSQNPLKDEEGNPLSDEEVNVTNWNKGTFLSAPVMNLPLKTGYKLKPGDDIVTFTPTSGNPNHLQFEFPNESTNGTWLETNRTIHNKNDYVIRNNTDSVSYSPSVVGVNPDSSSVEVLLPEGVFFEEGKSYTLLMSGAAGGNEVRLPVGETTTSKARVTLIRAADGYYSDEYTFENVSLHDVPNMPPVATPALHASFTKGDAPLTFGPGQLASDDDGDMLALSNPVSDDEGIAIASVIANQLIVSPIGKGTTNVQVDVSDGYQHTTTVTVPVTVIQQQTPAVFLGQVEVIRHENGTFTITIADVPAHAAVRLYSPENGEILLTQSQGAERGPLVLQLAGAGSMATAHITLEDTAADKSESNRVEMTLPEVEYKAALRSAIDEAQALDDQAVAGEGVGQYPPSAKSAFQAAIAAATAVRNDLTATKGQVEAAAEALHEAITEFERSKIVDSGKPEKPSNVTSVSTTTSITLSWHAVDTATEYSVVRNGVVLYAGVQPFFRDNGLQPGTRYDYEIYAWRGTQKSEPARYSAMTAAVTYPPQPDPASPITSFVANALTEDAASFTWPSLTGAAAVIIQQRVEGGAWENADTGRISPADTRATVKGLLPDTTYLFRLVVTGGINAGASNEVKATTKPAAQPKIVRLEASVDSLWLKPQKSKTFKLYAIYNNKKKREITREKNVSYQTSDAKLASTASGRITAGKNEGDALITIRYDDFICTVPVTVAKKQIVELQLSRQSAEMLIGDSTSLQAVAQLPGKEKRDVTNIAVWTSDHPDVVAVEAGKLTAIKAGTATVEVNYGGRSAQLEVTVQAESKVHKLTLSARKVTLEKGKSVGIAVTAELADGTKIDVSDIADAAVRNKAIASFADGEMTGLAEGTTRITFTYRNKTATLSVEVVKVKSDEHITE
ncbi:UNVERIFIED_CONTAM: hypothetical protein ABID98_005809 [Brevibacillus sp. OAP136]